MKKKKFLPLFALLIVCLLCVPSQAACKARPVFQSRVCYRYTPVRPAAPASDETSETPPSIPAPVTPEPETAPSAPLSKTPETAPSVPDASASSYESEVVRLVNDIRARYGLNPLTEDGELIRIARLKSRDMRENGYFSHTSPTYGTPFDMLKSFGVSYRAAGENIAYGYRTPAAVVEGWMNSEGHRANILNAAYTRIGVGYGSDGNYWTQLFFG